MKINTLLVLLFLNLFLNLSYSQACTSDDECSGLTAPCVEVYTCNLDTNQCEPTMKQCENGVACTDYCKDDESICESRRCVASEDPLTDSTCQRSYYNDCPEPITKCHNSYCDTFAGGCVMNNYTCDDEDGCTTDSCDPETGCIFTRRENCTDCFDYGCINNDACFPSICFVFDIDGNPYPWVPDERLRRDGNPYSECREVPVNCTTDDPCIYAYCKDGVCHFDDICSSENPTTTGAVTTEQTTDFTIGTATTTGGETTDFTTTSDLTTNTDGETTDFTLTGQTIDVTISSGQTIDYTIHNTHGHTIHHSGHSIHHTIHHTGGIGHSIHHTFTGGHTHGHSIHHSIGQSSIHNTIHQTGNPSSSSTISNSEEYNGPKYPNCLNCDDLKCESMGRRCKYLKSVESTCWEDDNNQRHNNKNKNHNNDQHNNHNNNNNNNNQHHNKNHFNIRIEEDGGYGGIIKNNHKKYPRKLDHDDCCPYTPTCY